MKLKEGGERQEGSNLSCSHFFFYTFLQLGLKKSHKSHIHLYSSILSPSSCPEGLMWSCGYEAADKYKSGLTWRLLDAAGRSRRRCNRDLFSQRKHKHKEGSVSLLVHIVPHMSACVCVHVGTMCQCVCLMRKDSVEKVQRKSNMSVFRFWGGLQLHFFQQTRFSAETVIFINAGCNCI